MEEMTKEEANWWYSDNISKDGMWSTGLCHLLKINSVTWGLGSATGFSSVVIFDDIEKRSFKGWGELKHTGKVASREAEQRKQRCE